MDAQTTGDPVGLSKTFFRRVSNGIKKKPKILRSEIFSAKPKILRSEIQFFYEVKPKILRSEIFK
jgi:hypothetical protein